MSENDQTGQYPASVEAALTKASAEATPAPPKPVRQFARTRFPTLPALSKAQLDKLTPQGRASYLREKKHEDDWGHLPPQIHETLRGVEPKDVAPNAVEKHAKTRGTDPVHFAAAKAYFKWGMHQEMTIEEYDSAIETVLSEKHGN